MNTDWDIMADIAEKVMELKGFTADDVRADLKHDKTLTRKASEAVPKNTRNRENYESI